MQISQWSFTEIIENHFGVFTNIMLTVIIRSIHGTCTTCYYKINICIVRCRSKARTFHSRGRTRSVRWIYAWWTRHRQGNALSSLCSSSWRHVDESRAIRYTYAPGTGTGSGSLTDPENKTIHSEVFTVGQRKERASTGIQSWFLLPRIPGIPGIQTYGRSRLSRPAKINESYVRRSEGMRKEESSRRDFPVAKARLTCTSPPANLPGRRMHASTDFARSYPGRYPPF